MINFENGLDNKLIPNYNGITCLTANLSLK